MSNFDNFLKQDALNQIDASIGLLKRARRQMQALAKHIHDFGKK
jgi:hypothetical protein